VPWTAKSNQTPILFYGQPFYKVEGHWGIHIKTFKLLLSESKIQVGDCLAPCGLGSPWETLKNIKIIKLGNFNFLAPKQPG
jgi:hypothetical protein